MSRDEVKETVKSQILTVFFLPLIVAGIHVFGAFHLISRMLLLFQDFQSSAFRRMHSRDAGNLQRDLCAGVLVDSEGLL